MKPETQKRPTLSLPSKPTEPEPTHKKFEAISEAPQDKPQQNQSPLVTKGMDSPEAVRAVKLLRDHGFVNEYDAVYHKKAGSIITNPIEIAILKKRGAHITEV